jgi:hypothetical protein
MKSFLKINNLLDCETISDKYYYAMQKLNEIFVFKLLIIE